MTGVIARGSTGVDDRDGGKLKQLPGNGTGDWAMDFGGSGPRWCRIILGVGGTEDPSDGAAEDGGKNEGTLRTVRRI
jgi:hypothetical protein